MYILGPRRHDVRRVPNPGVGRQQKMSAERIDQIHQFHRPDLPLPPKLPRRNLAPYRRPTRAKHVQRLAAILQSVLDYQLPELQRRVQKKIREL